MSETVLVSACLLGLPTRYDGSAKRNQTVLDWLAREKMIPIPVCPEQLAGLPTPREKTRFCLGDGRAVVTGNGAVITFSGQPMNEPFLRGAHMALRIARIAGCQRALLKERSPSCGVHQIHCNETMVAGVGVTTALLVDAGISVQSEEDLPADTR
ncbi:MAG: DUF523 domain-containing protein [Desulfuromonas sp.]|nr:DUF523 domain-containing protein [Desulfuromonas sp.]